MVEEGIKYYLNKLDPEMQQWVIKMRKHRTYDEMTNSLEYELDDQQARRNEYDIPQGINIIFSQKPLNH